MQQTFIAQMLQRIASKSPKFWKRLQIFFGVVLGLAVAFEYLLNTGWITLSDAALRERVENTLSDIWKFSFGGFIPSLMGTTNPDLMDDKTKERVIEHETGEQS